MKWILTTLFILLSSAAIAAEIQIVCDPDVEDCTGFVQKRDAEIEQALLNYPQEDREVIKKMIMTAVALAAVSTIAAADCTVTVNWTPSTSPDAAQQILYYNDAMNEVAKATGDMTLSSGQFVIPAPTVNDFVFVRTLDASGNNYADSAHVDVVAIDAATSIVVTTQCQ